MFTPQVIVTRPAPAAAQWAAQLAALGLPAVALPLIDIALQPLAGSLLAARQRLPGYQAVMFVSANAVAAFMQPEMPSSHTCIDFAAMQTRAWSPGPGTSAALRAAGWPPALVDEPAPDAPQFDSEALWARVAAQAAPGARVLIVRGGDTAGRLGGRDWLAARLRAAGVAVDEVLAYRRTAPRWSAAQRALAARAASDGSLWLFSSAEAIGNLRQCLPAQDWQAARALATHPRIAQAAQAAGFGRVQLSRPTLAAVAASIKSAA